MSKKHCKKKIEDPKLKIDCFNCNFSETCDLKKWNERQLELNF